MRVVAIFGPASARDLELFRKIASATWLTEVPVGPEAADAAIIFGGDGTVHRHLGAMVKLQLPVLVVPCGSGNDFARALGLRRTRDALQAWQRFMTGGANVREIDLGVIGRLESQGHAGEAPFEFAQGRSAPDKHYPHKHYFCCAGGVGLDAEIARRADRLPRWLLARGGYALSLPGALLRFAPFPMRITTAHFETNQPATLAAFANAPAYGGGMKIAPHAKLDDGLLDVCVVNDINKFKLFCLFPTIYFGRHLTVPEVQYFQADHLRLETETPRDVYADGEYVCQTPIEVSVERAALRVIVPRGEPLGTRTDLRG